MSHLLAEFDVSDVTRIARKAAAGQSLPLEVVAVVARGEDSAYVEIVVNTEPATDEVDQFVIGVFRNASEETLSNEIAAHLRKHLEHREGDG